MRAAAPPSFWSKSGDDGKGANDVPASYTLNFFADPLHRSLTSPPCPGHRQRHRQPVLLLRRHRHRQWRPAVTVECRPTRDPARRPRAARHHQSAVTDTQADEGGTISPTGTATRFPPTSSSTASTAPTLASVPSPTTC